MTLEVPEVTCPSCTTKLEMRGAGATYVCTGCLALLHGKGGSRLEFLDYNEVPEESRVGIIQALLRAALDGVSEQVWRRRARRVLPAGDWAAHRAAQLDGARVVVRQRGGEHYAAVLHADGTAEHPPGCDPEDEA